MSTGSFLLRGSCATCDSRAAGFLCSPRYRVRDKPNIDIKIKSTMMECSTLLRIQSFLAMNCLLGYRLLRPLGTTQWYSLYLTAVVPSYLVSDLAVPLVEVVQWRIDLNRYSTLTLLVDLRDLVNRLYDASVVSLCRWALVALLLSFSYVVELRRNRSPAPILLVYYFLLLFLLLLSIVTVSIDRINSI